MYQQSSTSLTHVWRSL